MSKIRIGIMGAGRGLNIAENFMLLDCEIAALCEIDEKRARIGLDAAGLDIPVFKDFDEFLNELQKILPDNEAFVLIEVGFEKLRYITGYSLILTSKVCEQIDLGIDTTKRVKELLGEEYELRISY